tara:strand:- start:3223 stop:4008 length:786 start_codon:yes stop_codon:yes gene_type:complete
MAERIDIQSPETGSEAPNQPIYEGFNPNESETMPQGQPEQASQEGYEVPDKFVMEDGSVDVAALAQSYQELERKQTTQTQEAPQDGMPETHDGSVLSQDNMQRYGEELSTNGELSSESLSALETAGFPREVVDQYVAGVKALAAQQETEMFSAVGGREGYDALTEWAGQNLSEAEINAYDAVMAGGDPNQIQMTIQGLHARYQQATGRPTLITGDTGQQGASTAFRSWSEVTEAMRDRRYQTDSAYRQDVTNRLAVSDLSA